MGGYGVSVTDKRDGGRVIPDGLAWRGGRWVSVESLIDAGLGTPEMIAWDAARTAEQLARWAVLPWYVRAWRRLGLPRWREAQRRLGHAYDALRGIECDD